MIRVRNQLALAAVAVACTGNSPGDGGRAPRGDVVDVARRLARGDASLSHHIDRGDGWRQQSGAFTSPGWRSARMGPGYEIGARLPARAADPIDVRIGRSEHYRIALTPLGANPSRGVEAGGRVTYSDVYPGVDLLATSEPQRIELFYLIREARPELRVGYRLERAPGLSRVTARVDGGVELRDSGGNLRLAFEPAYAIDASGVRRDASYERRDDQLDVVLDLEGLEFPVLLDPAMQVTAWERLGPPTLSSGAQLAYDNYQQQAVLVGDGETWQWDGARWWFRSSTGLGARTKFSVAYQSDRRRTLLYGGSLDTITGPMLIADTLEWDGFTWKKLIEHSAPGPRIRHAMCYDEKRHLAWMFGGLTSTSNNLGDFWQFDGSSWQQGPSGPGARSAAAMAYEPVRDRVVLFGGWNAANFLSETWEFDGTSWTERNVAGPSAAADYRMVYDRASQRMLLYAGHSNQDLWSWDGNSWTKLAAPGPSSWEQGLAYDSLRKRTLLFNGETWEFDGQSWLKRLEGTPPLREGHALSYDSLRHNALLFGGNERVLGDDWKEDTWTWNGEWQEQMVTGPSGRWGHGMVFDAARGRTLLFGGAEVKPFGDTWEFDGTSWQQRSTSGPSARGGFGFAYDSSRGRTLLFGGSDGTNTLGDTWEWDGNSWSKRATSGPQDRAYAALAYDPKRQRSVLFGGYRGAYPSQTYLSDTWEWSGSSWSNRNASGPKARGFHAMAYDAVLERVVLYGGSDDDVLGDTWAWDGVKWTQLGSGPPGRLSPAMAYDSDGQRLLLFGGKTRWQYFPSLNLTSYTPTSELWALAQHGAPCTTGGECPGGYCADGVCCNRPSCGPCQVCNLASSPGSCAKVCNFDDGVACTSDNQCNSGACVDGACCHSASCGNCESCNTASKPGFCVPVCDLATGVACQSDGACQSGFCSDGHCCESRCDAPCESCGESKTLGRCVVITGNSRSGRAPCPGAGSACGSQCDGSGPNGCVYAGADTVCGGGDRCIDGAERRARCDGDGDCVDQAPAPCGAYACGVIDCRTDCFRDSECASGYSCDINAHRCLPKVPGAVVCDGSHRLIGEDGYIECEPYTCSSDTNECLTSCSSYADCSGRNPCEDGHCIAPPGIFEETAPDEQSSCACRAAASRPSSAWWLVLGALLWGRRPKCRASSPRPRRSGAGSRAACGRPRPRTPP